MRFVTLKDIVICRDHQSIECQLYPWDGASAIRAAAQPLMIIHTGVIDNPTSPHFCTYQAGYQRIKEHGSTTMAKARGE